jgi:hypothetical protein
MHFVKKKVAGKTYPSIAEMHRVNGVPKTSIVKYVGSAEKLFKILIGLDKKKTDDILLSRKRFNPLQNLPLSEHL